MISYAILSALSRSPDDGDYADLSKPTEGNELYVLRREFPDLSALVAGQRVLDFGCGEGRQVIALTREENCSVVGVDTHIPSIEIARAAAARAGVESGVRFFEAFNGDLYSSFDVVISQNAFEHFGNPSDIMQKMRRLLLPGGKILITFGPPWFAPWGAHVGYFCKLPWVNLLFSERTVMRVRSRYRNDGAMRYEDVEAGLNKMTLRKFEGIVARSGLKIEYKKYNCVKGWNWLGKIPVLRELFVNHITCVLSQR